MEKHVGLLNGSLIWSNKIHTVNLAIIATTHINTYSVCKSGIFSDFNDIKDLICMLILSFRKYVKYCHLLDTNQK